VLGQPAQPQGLTRPRYVTGLPREQLAAGTSAPQPERRKVICPFCTETPRGYPSVIARGCLPAQVGSSAIGGFQ